MTLGYVFSLFFTFVLPLLIFIYVLFFAKDYRKAFIFGILSFSISQLLTRIPLLQYVLANQAWFILFTMKYQMLYIVLLSFSAGLFEESGRYLIFKKFLTHMNQKQILFFGLGHGGLEAFALIGLTLISLGFSGVSSINGFYAGFERISAMILHVGLSFVVYKSISNEFKWGYPLAILIHGLFNLIALLLILNGISTLIVEIILFVSAIVVVYFATRKKVTYEEMDH